MNRIVYNVLGFVQKEVISVDEQAPASSTNPNQALNPAQQTLDDAFGGSTYSAMDHLDPDLPLQNEAPAESPVRTVQKLEVSVLCAQHNPVSTAIAVCIAHPSFCI